MYCTTHPVCKSRLDDDRFTGMGSWSSGERDCKWEFYKIKGLFPLIYVTAAHLHTNKPPVINLLRGHK